MVRCSNETEGDQHDARPLVVTVMAEDAKGPDGALCPPCLAKAVENAMRTPPPDTDTRAGPVDAEN